MENWWSDTDWENREPGLLLLLLLHWYTINAAFRNIAHFRSVFCFLPPSLDTCRLFSIPPSHIYFGLPAFLLPSGFPRNICFTVSSSDILTRWPAQ